MWKRHRLFHLPGKFPATENPPSLHRWVSQLSTCIDDFPGGISSVSHDWLLVWKIWLIKFHLLGNSSCQLVTFYSTIFQRGGSSDELPRAKVRHLCGPLFGGVRVESAGGFCFKQTFGRGWHPPILLVLSCLVGMGMGEWYGVVLIVMDQLFPNIPCV